MPHRFPSRLALTGVLFSFFLLPCSFFLFPSSVLAQPDPVFRTSTDIVMVPVTVTDGSGRFVFGLTEDQFELSDDGSRRPLVQFSTERVPVSLAILLDISGSMSSDPKAALSEDARWSDTRRALELLVTRLDPRDEVLFAVFNEKVALAVPWTHDHRQILRTFNSVRPAGTTALFGAVESIAPAFQLARYQRKVLLLISDGQDSKVPTLTGLPVYRYPLSRDAQIQVNIHQRHKEVRDRAVSASQHAARGSGAAVYAIGVGTQKGAAVNLPNLEGLTKPFGGYIEHVRDPSDIAAAVARICDDLQAQYLLAFEPSRADGKYHEIALRMKRRGLTARTRSGYVAPARTTP